MVSYFDLENWNGGSRVSRSHFASTVTSWVISFFPRALAPPENLRRISASSVEKYRLRHYLESIQDEKKSTSGQRDYGTQVSSFISFIISECLKWTSINNTCPSFFKYSHCFCQLVQWSISSTRKKRLRNLHWFPFSSKTSRAFKLEEKSALSSLTSRVGGPSISSRSREFWPRILRAPYFFPSVRKIARGEKNHNYAVLKLWTLSGTKRRTIRKAESSSQGQKKVALEGQRKAKCQEQAKLSLLPSKTNTASFPLSWISASWMMEWILADLGRGL